MDIKNPGSKIQYKPKRCTYIAIIKLIKKVNVSKIANNINTVGDDSTAAGCNSRLITVLVQHAHHIVSVT